MRSHSLLFLQFSQGPRPPLRPLTHKWCPNLLSHRLNMAVAPLDLELNKQPAMEASKQRPPAPRHLQTLVDLEQTLVDLEQD